jgi:hypothetical protein
MTCLRVSIFAFLFACGGATVQPPPRPGDVHGPGPLNAAGTLPNLPGWAYFDLDCRRDPAMNEWDFPEYEMHVAGKVTECDVHRSNNTMVIRLKNASVPSEDITIQLAAIAAEASRRYPVGLITISDSLSLPSWQGPYNSSGSWTGPAATASHAAGAPDTCGSGACTIQVDDADPAAPYPKELRFHVSCSTMCVNGTQSGGHDGVVCYQHGAGPSNPASIEEEFTGTCNVLGG